MRAPVSLVFFVPQLLVLLLQLFPGTGVFLMVLGAPAWAILLLNVPMLLCAVEAALRPGLRIWLLLPGLWFGGYGLFVGVDRASAAWSRHRAEATNASVHVAFDPRRDALVILGDQASRVEMNNRGEWFAGSTNLPVVYLRDETFKDLPYAAMRLAERDLCQIAKSEGAAHGHFGLEQARNLEAGVRRDFLSERTEGWTSRVDEKVCVLSAPEAIERPITTVTFEPPGRGGTRGTVAIVTPDGRRQVLRALDQAAPWPWIPLPLLGCGLNGGAAKWECGFKFMRGLNLSPQKSEDGLAASNLLVARGLGLISIAKDQRRPSEDAVIRAMGDRARDRAAREQLAVLDVLLADPEASVRWVEFSNLAGRSDLIGQRLPRAVDLVERGAASPLHSRARENARIVFGLLQKLPDAAIAPYRPRLDALRGNEGFRPQPWATAWTR